MASPARVRLVPIALIVVLTVSATSAIYAWAQRTVAIPGCTVGAREEHASFVRYVPIRFLRSNRMTPDGECEFASADGRPLMRSLTRYLTGPQQLTSVGLRYDMVGGVLFVGWGFLIGVIVRARDSRQQR